MKLQFETEDSCEISDMKDSFEISFWCQRQLWNFILRPRAAVKCRCNRCTDLTSLRNVTLQQTRLCIKYSRLVPNATNSVTYRHHGFSNRNRSKIVWIYGSLKCFSCMSISDKGASEWVSVSWTIYIFYVLYSKQLFETLFLHGKWENLSNVLTEFTKTSWFLQNP
jgi:hypothetical protein